MTFEPECRDEWSAWIGDRFSGMLLRRASAWVALDIDEQEIGRFALRREAIAAIRERARRAVA